MVLARFAEDGVRATSLRTLHWLSLHKYQDPDTVHVRTVWPRGSNPGLLSPYEQHLPPPHFPPEYLVTLNEVCQQQVLITAQGNP